VLGNSFQACLKDKPPTSYNLLKALDNAADFNLNLRTFVIDVCENGCVAFFKETINDVCCKQCKKFRWNFCNEECNDLHNNKM
jgi:hypothetical protein